MVVWCRGDYIKEANKQLEHKTVYKDVDLKETRKSLHTQIYYGERTQTLFL